MLWLFPLILIIALLNALAFWQRHIFIYFLVAIPDCVFGLFYAFQSDPLTGKSAEYTPTWYVGATVGVIGVFCLYRGIDKLWTDYIKRR